MRGLVALYFDAMKLKAPSWARKCEGRKSDVEATMRRKGEIQAWRYKALQGRNKTK